MTYNERLLILALAKSVAHLSDAVTKLAHLAAAANKESILEEANLASVQLDAVADLMEKEWGADVKSKVD